LMATLDEMLNRRTWYALWAVAHAYGLPFWGRDTRAKAAARLHDQLIVQGHLRRMVRQLSTEARAPLAALQAAGGRMRFVEFTRLFGAFRLYRPWRKGMPRHPWKAPTSVAEQLWYLALIDRDGSDIYAPVEVLRLLPPLPRVHATQTVDATVLPPDASLRIDLAHLLGVLMSDNVPVRWGRWLPPRALKAICERLTVQDDLTNVRSELQTARLRSLHYLLEAAGLVAVQGGCLKPTVAAWQWLDQPARVQWQTLYDSIEADLRRPRPLWNVYRLPAMTADLWHTLAEQLARLHTDKTYTVKSLVDSLRPRLPGHPINSVPDLLRGPLMWLGLVAQPDSRTFRAYLPPPAAVPDANAQLLIEADLLRVVLPAVPRLRALVELSAWAAYHPRELWIDQQAVKRAVATHHTALQIAAALAAIIDQPLPSDAWDKLQQWERQQRQLTLHETIVLSSPDPALLSALLNERGMRPLLGKPLSAHHLEVKPHGVRTLARRLVRHGLIITDSRLHEHVPSDGSLSPNLAEQLWLACRIYQALADYLPMPSAIPGATLDWISTHLADHQIDRLTQYANHTIAELNRTASDGWFSATTPLAQVDPVAIRTAVERAYQERAALTIDYFSPAQGYPTRRTIEPLLPIRQRGDYVYVEAWCREVEAERAFRLDRILCIVDPPDDAA
ncbi:MAG: WYL domain-containing protein, partial [Anaerolineae bacterium]|nr:WYL domain-containing protein [Anaerolineae bacterium]